MANIRCGNRKFRRQKFSRETVPFSQMITDDVQTMITDDYNSDINTSKIVQAIPTVQY
jgi:hypothetical protein